MAAKLFRRNSRKVIMASLFARHTSRMDSVPSDSAWQVNDGIEGLSMVATPVDATARWHWVDYPEPDETKKKAAIGYEKDYESRERGRWKIKRKKRNMFHNYYH